MTDMCLCSWWRDRNGAVRYPNPQCPAHNQQQQERDSAPK